MMKFLIRKVSKKISPPKHIANRRKANDLFKKESISKVPRIRLPLGLHSDMLRFKLCLAGHSIHLFKGGDSFQDLSQAIHPHRNQACCFLRYLSNHLGRGSFRNEFLNFLVDDEEFEDSRSSPVSGLLTILTALPSVEG
jgi:hypothetical protein